MKIIAKRFHSLDDMATQIENGRKSSQFEVMNRKSIMHPPTPTTKTRIAIDSDLFFRWRTSVESLLFQVFGSSHPTYIRFAEDARKPSFDGLHSAFSYLRSLFLSAKDDFEGGYLFNLRQLVHADVFANELEQAEYFLSEGYKIPAAVVAGTVLESTLRELCSSHGVVILDINKQDVTRTAKLDRMNSELTKANVYNSTRQKQITAWAAIRNNAAHGKPNDFDDTQVRDMISGITDFVAHVMHSRTGLCAHVRNMLGVLKGSDNLEAVQGFVNIIICGIVSSPKRLRDIHASFFAIGDDN